MGPMLERRRRPGRRATDESGLPSLRGLLHDIGHEVSALASLVEVIRGDVTLPEGSKYRLELLSMEMERLLDLVNHGLRALVASEEVVPVNVQQMLKQLADLAGVSHGANVTVMPGPDVVIDVNSVVLWRVLSNVVDNAARAAGRGGRVTLGVWQDSGTIIEVADDGPGFGAGPPGTASLGLEILTSLLGACGGSLEVSPRPSRGTVVRVEMPQHAAALVAADPGPVAR